MNQISKHPRLALVHVAMTFEGGMGIQLENETINTKIKSNQIKPIPTKPKIKDR